MSLMQASNGDRKTHSMGSLCSTRLLDRTALARWEELGSETFKKFLVCPGEFGKAEV